jgi:DNA-binding response OmpR family regulator
MAVAMILLIEDEPAVRETVRQVLASEGHDVICASDGRKGVDLFRKSVFDLVVTDIIMPEKEGIQTISEIRAINPRARIIAMSGGGRVGSTDFLSVASKLGANDTIAKPFDPEDLIAKVDKLMKA